MGNLQLSQDGIRLEGFSEFLLPLYVKEIRSRRVRQKQSQSGNPVLPDWARFPARSGNSCNPVPESTSKTNPPPVLPDWARFPLLIWQPWLQYSAARVASHPSPTALRRVDEWTGQ